MSDAPDEYPYDRAWNYVLWLLGRQAYTTGQLKDKLSRKGATEETVTKVLEKLVELKLVDDALYAEAFVRSRSRSKGAIRLRQELFRKGVAEPDVDKAVGELGEETQLESALALAEKNLWRWEGGAAPTLRQSLRIFSAAGVSGRRGAGGVGTDLFRRAK